MLIFTLFFRSSISFYSSALVFALESEVEGEIKIKKIKFLMHKFSSAFFN